MGGKTTTGSGRNVGRAPIKTAMAKTGSTLFRQLSDEDKAKVEAAVDKLMNKMGRTSPALRHTLIKKLSAAKDKAITGAKPKGDKKPSGVDAVLEYFKGKQTAADSDIIKKVGYPKPENMFVATLKDAAENIPGFLDSIIYMHDIENLGDAYESEAGYGGFGDDWKLKAQYLDKEVEYQTATSPGGDHWLQGPGMSPTQEIGFGSKGELEGEEIIEATLKKLVQNYIEENPDKKVIMGKDLSGEIVYYKNVGEETPEQAVEMANSNENNGISKLAEDSEKGKQEQYQKTMEKLNKETLAAITGDNWETNENGDMFLTLKNGLGPGITTYMIKKKPGDNHPYPYTLFGEYADGEQVEFNHGSDAESLVKYLENRFQDYGIHDGATDDGEGVVLKKAQILDYAENHDIVLHPYYLQAIGLKPGDNEKLGEIPAKPMQMQGQPPKKPAKEAINDAMKDILAGKKEGEGVTPAAPVDNAPTIVGNPMFALGKAADIMAKQVGPKAGTNEGGVYQSPDGKTRYVKLYKESGQAYGEAVANSFYNALGIPAASSTMFITDDGKIGLASDMVEGAKELKDAGLTKERANSILDGFAADMLLANWDVVGNNEGLMRNIVVGKDGKCYRIDNGGALLYSGLKGKKPAAALEGLGEWNKFVEANPGYQAVFEAAGIKSAEEMKDRLIQQVQKIQELYDKTHGFGELVPHLEVGQKDVVPFSEQTQMLQVMRKKFILLKKKLGLPE